MRTCPQCGTKHAKVSVTVLDVWTWNANDIAKHDPRNPAEEWRAQQVASMRRAYPDQAVTGRLYRRTVRAGGAFASVVVGVVSIRTPWHRQEGR